MAKQPVKPVSRQTGKHAPVNASKAKQAKKKPMWVFPYSKNNYIIALIGVGVVVLGYVLMATGISSEPAHVHGVWNNPFAVSISPIVLIIGYCVIIPYAIMKYYGKKNDETDKPAQ